MSEAVSCLPDDLVRLRSLRVLSGTERRVHMANVWDVLDPDNKGMPDHLRHACSVRFPRSINSAGNGDAVVIPKEQYDPRWIDYLGELTGRGVEVIDVEPGPSNPATTEEIVDCIAGQVSSRERGRTVFEGYIESGNLARAVRRRGMSAGPSCPGLIEAGLTERINHKGWLHRSGEVAGDPTTLRYFETEGLHDAWRAVVGFMEEFGGAMARAPVGGGGFNNWLAQKQPDGTYRVRFAQGNPTLGGQEMLEEHLAFFMSMAPENRQLVITPWVDVVESPSVHFELTPEGIICTGVYDQLLDFQGECIGGRRVNLGHRDQARRAVIARATYPLASRAWRLGKRGHFAPDVMEVKPTDRPKLLFPDRAITTPGGNLIVVAEVNGRKTSNSEHGRSAEAYATANGKYPGETTWAVQEVVPINSAVTFDQVKTVLGKEKLLADPCADPEQRRGILVTNPPTLGNVGLTAVARGGGPERAEEVEDMLRRAVVTVQGKLK